LECAGKAKRRRRFWFLETGSPERIQSGVALRLPPHSKDAVYSDFGFEILQSSNLSMVAAVLSFYSNVF
jgi:hypothetical protein